MIKMFLEQAMRDYAHMVQDRHYLHQNAETGHDLPKTVAYVRKQLTAMGYAPYDVGDSGLCAIIGNKKPGKVFLLRADMDALPIKEESGLAFACSTGAAHACGHDLHTAMLLGAARILKDYENDINGTIKLMFQPAEEIFSGALSMINDNILENPHVDAAFCIHVAADKPLGFLGYNKSHMLASSDTFQIDITGKGCHGAMPHFGVDPINVASYIHSALQEIIAREIPASETLVITVGQISAGHAVNIIPEHASMKGTIRAYAQHTRDLAIRRLQEISKHIALAFRAKATVTMSGSVPSVHCDKDVASLLVTILEKITIENSSIEKRNSMGSEDFAFIAQRVPSAFLALGAGQKDESKRLAAHNPQVIFDEDCMPFGAAIHAAMAINWLKSNI